MKKIVALVLSLVMALSLCTVAFASTTPTLYALDETGSPDTDATSWAVEKLDAMRDTKNGGGWVTRYVYPDKASATHWYIPVEKEDADYAIYNNGRFVDWVKQVTSFEETHYCCTMTAQKATTALPNCTTTQYLVDGYVDANGDFFVKNAAGDHVALVDGVLVKVSPAASNEVLEASHIFAKGVKNDKTGYDVATCLICKGEFACTNDEKVATKNGYKVSTGFAYNTLKAEIVYDENAYDNGYDFAWGQDYASDYKFCWQLKAGTTEEIGTAATETTTGVESAKTFDAGIAMYVGMSLMSVAGTAVVIGKKKEF